MRRLLLPLLLLAPLPALCAGAHDHGAARLDVALDGTRLSLTLEMPLDALLGFERAPRTDAERQAAAAALKQLRDAALLFRPDAAAQCRPVAANVNAPVLQPGAKTAGEHADADASYDFDCAAPQALKTLDVALFDTFRRLQRVDVQLAGPKAQARVVLKRPARTLTLPR